MINEYLGKTIIFKFPKEDKLILGIDSILNDSVLCYTIKGLNNYYPRGLKKLKLDENKFNQLQKLTIEERVTKGYCVWHNKNYIEKAINNKV